jgi:hypothetical protein
LIHYACDIILDRVCGYDNIAIHFNHIGAITMNDFYMYAVGYYDGRVNGQESEHISGKDRYYYKAGYDRGIADYCELDLDNEPEMM